jgi:hypothetical protein
METERDSLIARMEQARAQLDRALENVIPQTDFSPTWKIKQLLDHITGWDELMVRAYQAHARGEPPGPMLKGGIDQYNALSVDARNAMSYEESLQAYHAARGTVLQALAEMPAERLGVEFQTPWGQMCTVARVVEIFVSHEMEHARQVEEL